MRDGDEVAVQRAPRRYMSIRLSTWQKDSHGLFNYSQQDSTKFHKDYQLPLKTKQVLLFRNEKTNESTIQLKQRPPPTKKQKNGSPSLLYRVVIRPNLESKKMEFLFQGMGEGQGQGLGEAGLVVGREVDGLGNAKGRALAVGNVVCFGRIKYLVRQIKLNGNLQTFKPQTKKSPPEPEPSPTNQQKLQCKICFDSSSTPQNRLISICKCTGSCKYCHFLCLKQWLDTKVKINAREFCISVEKIDCEICKAEIPLIVNLGQGEGEELVFVERPVGDYLMLEKVSGMQKNILIVKSLPHEGVSIGRDASSYIKIPDISVSRVHAFIRYSKGEFHIFDNNSKFGTLIIENPMKLTVGMTRRAVQIGRTVMEISVRQENSVLAGI